jgi:acylglycerol lipase
LTPPHSIYVELINPSQPDTPPRATLVFIHGFSDHINRYNQLMTYLASRGIAVHGFDQRGWGRSVSKPAEKGLTGTTSRVLSDMAAFIRPHIPSSPSSSPPLFVMGHSMGGGQVLRFMCDNHDGGGRYADIVRAVRGWLVEAPYLGLSPEEQPSRLTVALGRLAGRVFPRAHYYHEIRPENLSRVPEMVESIRGDALMHNTGTLEGLASMIDRTSDLSSGRTRPEPGKVRSLWVGHGTEDKATAYSETKKWFDDCAGAIPDRELKTYEGAYHQLHADLCREEFERDVADWVLARCEGDGPAEAGTGVAQVAEAKPTESKL